LGRMSRIGKNETAWPYFARAGLHELVSRLLAAMELSMPREPEDAVEEKRQRLAVSGSPAAQAKQIPSKPRTKFEV
jgi:hypothetical protein